jgi:glyoxylase-like metal-dependent hydrolase (beta-lactamase superfamily II)
MSIQELELYLKNEPMIIDTRNEDEIFKNGRIDYFKYKKFKFNNFHLNSVNEIPKDQEILISGTSGTLIENHRDFLLKNDFKNIKTFRRLTDYWSASGKKMYVFDKYENSPLYSKLKKVSNNIYTSIGAPHPPSASNFGHNNNLSVITLEDGLLLFNASGSYILAQSLHREIKKVTSLPVKYLVYENHQAHAVLGSRYWKEQGATIISHKKTRTLLTSTESMKNRAKKRLGNLFFKSEALNPDIVFEKYLELGSGDKKIVLNYFGEAHGIDDISLWHEKDRVLITGDLGFRGRMMPLTSSTNIPSWIEIWDKMIDLNPNVVIPGHGEVGVMGDLELATIDYITFIYNNSVSVLDDDGELSDVLEIKDDEFKRLTLYDALRYQNLYRLFNKLEFE